MDMTRDRNLDRPNAQAMLHIHLPGGIADEQEIEVVGDGRNPFVARGFILFSALLFFRALRPLTAILAVEEAIEAYQGVYSLIISDAPIDKLVSQYRRRRKTHRAHRKMPRRPATASVRSDFDGGVR